MRIEQKALPEHINAEMNRRLVNTDWAALRLAETGKAISGQIASHRKKVRARGKKFKAMKDIPFDYRDHKYWPKEPLS